VATGEMPAMQLPLEELAVEALRQNLHQMCTSIFYIIAFDRALINKFCKPRIQSAD